MIKKIWPLVLVILFSLLPLRFVFQGGFFPIHDEAQVIRVNQMAKAISEGQFPVRWVSDLGYGYGYPIFNFYNPLPYYFGGMVDLLGLDALLATKAMFVIGFLLGRSRNVSFGKQAFWEICRYYKRPFLCLCSLSCNPALCERQYSRDVGLWNYTFCFLGTTQKKLFYYRNIFSMFGFIAQFDGNNYFTVFILINV